MNGHINPAVGCTIQLFTKVLNASEDRAAAPPPSLFKFTEILPLACDFVSGMTL